MAKQTIEEKKAKLKISNKKWATENPDKKKAYKAAYMLAHPQKFRDYDKKWREKNPEFSLKRSTINGWVSKGLVCDNPEALYDEYLLSPSCEWCCSIYSKKGNGVGRFKTMDHSHKTGLFRNFLCHVCNIQRGE